MTISKEKEDAISAFQEIFTQRHELQNWSSSSWWFFLLLPKQQNGFGPKQMMFTFASRSGELIKVNDTWQRGFRIDRNPYPIDKFMTTVVGWINDGEEVHEEIIHQPALAELNTPKRKMAAWVDRENGEQYGGEFEAVDDMHISSYFKGAKGFADFEVWSDPNDKISFPHISDIRGPANGALGGTHLVAWRKLNFKGTFSHPNGTEDLDGVGYFQRVCMNVPMFPWKWIWVVFEDESMFSSFVPYLGFQNFRRGDSFFPGSLERLVKPVIPVAYFNFHKDGDAIYFDNVDVKIFDKNGKISRKHPKVYVHAYSDNGDYLKMIIKAHGHTQFLLDRRVIGKIWQTKYNYNEFMIKVIDYKGKIKGKTLTKSDHGNGWGNMEYTWGMSL